MSEPSSEQQEARAAQVEPEPQRLAPGELMPEQSEAPDDRLVPPKSAQRENAPHDDERATDGRLQSDTAAALDGASAAPTEACSTEVKAAIPVAKGEVCSTLDPIQQVGRRWTCLQEASGTKSARLKFWDGCGMETNAIVGRRVDVQGLGTGKCIDMRQARLGMGYLHRVVLDSGATKEAKLLHSGPDGAGASGDIGFSLEDEQPSDQPWRWSDDPRFPPPQPGEIGNLSSAQIAAVESFRQLANANDVEEPVVIRYLRANDFDVTLANDQWAATQAWRHAEDIDSLMHTQLPPRVCETPLLLQGLYPHMMAGYDRGGRPVRVECMGRVNTKEMYKYTTEEAIMRYHAWQNEEIQHRFLPAASLRTGHVQTQVTVVLDMTNAKLGDLLSSEARTHIKNFIQVTSDFYPEILNTMVIVNAPRLLSMAWDFVAPLLDAGTKRKITIAPPGPRTRSLLHTIVHPSQLPRFLGGELPTPLDTLLPIIDGGGGPDDFETVSKGWDGYWGLSTAEPAVFAVPAPIVGGNRVAGLGQVPQGNVSADELVPQVSGQPPAAAASMAARAPESLSDQTGACEDTTATLLSKSHAEMQEQRHAASTIAVSYRHAVKKQQKRKLKMRTAGAEKINALLNQADQWIANANWLRAETKLKEVLASGEFEQWYPEVDDYGEVYEILGSCAVAKGDYEAAMDHYSEGLKHRPDGPRLRLGRGRAYARLGNPAAAMPDLNFALALRPTHGPTAALVEEVSLMPGAIVEALTDAHKTQTARVKRMLFQIKQKEEESSSLKEAGRDSSNENDAALNEQWAVTMQSSMSALAAEQTTERLVEERAAAYFANIESLRLLALQILKGSPDRPGYRAADGVGDDWQLNASSEHSSGGATLGAHVRITRDDLSAAIGRMNTGVAQETVIEALNALYGSDRTARIGSKNPDAKSEVEWADVECWWSTWASQLCARSAKDPGVLRQRKVNVKARTDGGSAVTFFAIEIVEPSSHDKTPQCSAKCLHRYSEFDALRSDLITACGDEVASIVEALPFPRKTWGVVALTEVELEERRDGLESWLQKLVTDPRIAIDNDCTHQMLQRFLDGVAAVQEGQNTKPRIKTITTTDV